MPLGRINTGSGQHLGMHHARAQNFHPIVAFTDLQLPLVPRTTQIDLCRGLGEWEMRRAKAQFDIVDFKISAAKLFEHPFEVGHAQILVDRKALNLMEHRCVRLIII